MTLAFNHDPFMAALRKRRGKVPADLYADIIAAIEASQAGGMAPTTPPFAATGEPKWLDVARAMIGLKEVVGPQHNSRIVAMFAAAKAAWFKDDETPWCGAFVAYCMIQCGLPIPEKGEAVRAKAWASWGVSCGPVLGAIVVFGREGGGHVGILVGQSATHYYVLGGNQSNQVNIMPIAKSRMVAGGLRWPFGVPVSTTIAPKMSGGTVSTNER